MMSTSFRLSVIVLVAVLTMAFPGFAAASPLSNLVDSTLGTVDTTLGMTLGLVDTTLNSVLSGDLTSGLNLPTVDVNATLNQTIDTVNSLNLVQLPQTNLPIPAIDPNQLLGNTLDTANQVLTTPPLGTLTDPLLPGGTIPGGTGTTTDPSGLITGLSSGVTLNGPLVAQAVPSGFVQSAASPIAFGLDNFQNDGTEMQATPTGSTEDSLGPFSLSSGLALLPAIGLVCGLLGLLAYFRNARQVWQARGV